MVAIFSQDRERRAFSIWAFCNHCFGKVYESVIYNANNIDNTGMAAAYNQTTDVLKRWQGEGTSNSMPRAVFGDPNQNTRVSDRFVENGSYLRLKTESSKPL